MAHTFERLVEVLDRDPGDKVASRVRWLLDLAATLDRTDTSMWCNTEWLDNASRLAASARAAAVDLIALAVQETAAPVVVSTNPAGVSGR